MAKKIHFDTYRDQVIIEGILNELYDSRDKAGIFKFCTKNPDGELYLRDYSLKQWMNDLYGKIISYTGDNKLILEAKYELIDIANTICELDSDKKLFNDLEVEAGKAMFEVFNHLFGHFTIRLAMMGMLDWYLKPKTKAEPERIKIQIKTRSDWITVRNTIRRYCMVPSSKYIPYTSVPSIEVQMRTKDVYSLLFEDSHLFLPTGKMNELMENAVFFGYSPVEIIDGSNTIPSLYSKFESKTPRVELYTRSCEAMLKVVEEAIIDKVFADTSYYCGYGNLARWNKIKELTELAKEQIFDPTDTAHVRLAIEKFMKSNDYKSVQGVGMYSHRINIMSPQQGVGEKSVPYEIFLDKDDLTGLNIQTWGHVKRSFSKVEVWNCMADKHPDDPFWTK